MKKLMFIILATLHLNTNAQVCFGAPKPANTNYGPSAVSCADFNNDGKPDVVASNFNNNTVAFLSGTGTAQFNPTGNFPVGGQPAGITSGDFDHDG
ncbi:MAG: FG-GAP repeat domain-containing protein, partial [Bacteroidia bacterium]